MDVQEQAVPVEEISEHANILELPGLVAQKTKAVEMLNVTTKKGDRLNVSADGCMVVSLYDALKINGYENNFEEFLKSLVTNDCIRKDGSVEWAAFNNSDTGYQFRWMQDNEVEKCDKVQIKNLEDWVTAGNFALVKVQSVYLPWRRHFMVVNRIDKESAECLEASASDGKLKLRTIPENQILGVRYFELKQNRPQPTQSAMSPFTKTEPNLSTLVTA